MSEQNSTVKNRYVAVAGNIGAGKSSLTGLLGKKFQWETFFESVDDNPYLSDFYEDMRRWSFNLQIYFLSSRFRHQKEMLESSRSLIQDRTIYEDVEIFAKNLHRMNLMSDRDFKNYSALFHQMSYYLRPPDLLIYLRADVPTLVRQIQNRGRDYENTIRIEYLESLNTLYEDWISRYPHEKLIIDTDHLDFVNREEDLGSVIRLVEQRLFGLF
ncbi:MAG: deoxynucleoside kinase [Bacteroidetes bacterium]|jgi:deoxyadenosine/deoxycytidine kinase|nr:deoxynucleoside kinase [Bacteroidota bacterium]PTM15853.1 MAG: deoxynucleoside kinase [Bacteroidota bacterium]PTM20262.1 MAG: deoxynucleoside kinase [Bacteroidota bacterium]